jgi:hypothetical protein
MPDETLLLLITDVRRKTLRLIDGASEAELRYAPPGLVNTLLWHAGHALVVNEHLGLAAATGQPPQDPEGYFGLFSWKSQPAKVKEWPAAAEVVRRLEEQRDRLLTAVAALSEEQLDRPFGDPAKGRTVRHSILHGLHDEANHQGEMWLLKKLYAKQLGVH